MIDTPFDAPLLDPQAAARRARIAALLPALGVRYHRLTVMLEGAAAGGPVNDWDLDLAIADLSQVLAIMTDDRDEDEADAP